MYGQEVKQETRKKISEANKGKERSQEYKERQRLRMRELWKSGRFSKRKPMSLEQLKNFTQSSVGTFWWNNGNANRRSKESPGDSWNRGRIFSINIHTTS